MHRHTYKSIILQVGEYISSLLADGQIYVEEVTKKLLYRNSDGVTSEVSALEREGDDLRLQKHLKTTKDIVLLDSTTGSMRLKYPGTGEVLSFNFPTGDGVAGQVLKTNGAGLTSWGETDATAITNDAITNEKAANMATKTYKGRTAGTTGDPEDVPVATLKTDLSLVKADVGLTNVTDDAQLKRAAGDFSSFPSKTTVVDADVFLIEDSQDEWAKKQITKSQIGGTPAGSNTQIQYNKNGGFSGHEGLVYDETNAILTVGYILPGEGRATLQNNGGGSWTKSRLLTVTAPVQDLPAGYSVKFVLTGTTAANIFESNTVNALRIATTGSELHRFVEIFTAANITIWFKLQTLILAGQTSTDYTLYYENDLCGVAPTTWSNVFTKVSNDTNANLVLEMDAGTGTTVIDTSGNNNNGTLTGGTLPTWVGADGGQWKNQNIQFETGNCLAFSGGYISVANSANFDFAGGDFAIEYWFRPTQETRMSLFAGNTDLWMGMDYHYNGTRNINMWASSTGTSWNLIHADGGGNGIGGLSLALNAWNHIVWTRQGNVWRTYVNNVLDKSITVAGSIITRTEIKRIGLWGNGVFQLVGRVDAFRAYKGRFFSADEVNARYGRRMWVTADTTAIDGNFATVGSEQVAGSPVGGIVNVYGKLSLKEGANCSMGIAILVGGTIVVNNTLVTTNSRIFLTKQTDGNNGVVCVSARTAGVSFTISSSNAADTGSVAWWIVEPT